jgi:isopentenyldiphosphate isomerase
MDLQSRKLQFIQEFLRINSEEIINKLDKFMHEERKKIHEQELKPMSLEQFNEMIDRSEDDFANGRVIEVNDLKNEIAKWK